MDRRLYLWKHSSWEFEWRVVEGPRYRYVNGGNYSRLPYARQALAKKFPDLEILDGPVPEFVPDPFDYLGLLKLIEVENRGIPEDEYRDDDISVLTTICLFPEAQVMTHPGNGMRGSEHGPARFFDYEAWEKHRVFGVGSKYAAAVHSLGWARVEVNDFDTMTQLVNLVLGGEYRRDQTENWREDPDAPPPSYYRRLIEREDRGWNFEVSHAPDGPAVLIGSGRKPGHAMAAVLVRFVMQKDFLTKTGSETKMPE